ncbi:translation initiation factor IF-2-like [Portunus trituberculatus]|uniref:Uncharacterized protein n=1 Tax=Portunus trituberculatus TaxID=210409 RepID=A0A5B7GZG1_PORTR|nr:translation initiation factor IF-2-like [Portunus trituberculatus]MPC62298.1 hypothetical protein [Portunus trituberculatus]
MLCRAPHAAFPRARSTAEGSTHACHTDESRCSVTEGTPLQQQQQQQAKGSVVQRLRQATARHQQVKLVSSFLLAQCEERARAGLQVTGRRVAARDAHARAAKEDSESPARHYLVRVEQLLAARRRGREAPRCTHAITGTRAPVPPARTPVAAQRDRGRADNDANSHRPGSHLPARFPRPHPVPGRREPRAPALCDLLLVQSSVLCEHEASRTSRPRHQPSAPRRDRHPRPPPRSRRFSAEAPQQQVPRGSPGPPDPCVLFTVTVRPATAAQQHHRQQQQQHEAPPPLRQSLSERGGGALPPPPPPPRVLALAPASPRLCAHVSTDGGGPGRSPAPRGAQLPASPRSLQLLTGHRLSYRQHPDSCGPQYIAPRGPHLSQSDAPLARVHTLPLPPPLHSALVTLGTEQRPPG